ncbi:5-formyltetrahydrofolate cyclo-ligase [Aestuariivirga litoralis]|uniref:5-formyltetrahydrofolate cyclo-ligase n=1 Tax=Aestuariivirga litoralis TaxID=2650924 RepID=A0A2W2CCU4_9HYPH|nr:5-formyltetrahydrofolate cyclo-ligase [Aestuariivirga litoralis]PZF78043.1 5-formyltetrahydrofolate cyclo-ligase [Aestuariivirga litoralis]
MGSGWTRGEVMAWRKSERERLIAARLAAASDQRAAWSHAIADVLQRAIGAANGLIVSTYWPFRGEPDLRPLMARLEAMGGCCALPVVLAKGQPLVFRRWKEGEPLVRGVWNIPVPAEGAEVEPDVVIAPVVGFDPHCFRLGYGGGFFDRTLALRAPRPRVFGVGYELQAIATIHPLGHDIPMQAIVTEAGLHQPAALQ